MFHNKGLSIYSLKDYYVDRHEIKFVENHQPLEQVFLPSFEDKLASIPKDFRKEIDAIIDDVRATVPNIVKSCGRQGVLLSHSLLQDPMRPHLHRQAYAVDPMPCVTIHYRIGNNTPSNFVSWDRVDQSQAIQHNLCGNQEILHWCQDRPSKILPLVNSKNVLIFDSWAVPHCVEHSDALNLYFIFDHADVIGSDGAIIL